MHRMTIYLSVFDAEGFVDLPDHLLAGTADQSHEAIMLCYRVRAFRDKATPQHRQHVGVGVRLPGGGVVPHPLTGVTKADSLRRCPLARSRQFSARSSRYFTPCRYIRAVVGHPGCRAIRTTNGETCLFIVDAATQPSTSQTETLLQL